MLNLPEVEREILTFISMERDRGGPAEEKFDSRAFSACFHPRTKMAAGSVNCEAAFLNFNADFEQNG